jgi:hypothetical protein
VLGALSLIVSYYIEFIKVMYTLVLGCQTKGIFIGGYSKCREPLLSVC